MTLALNTDSKNFSIFQNIASNLPMIFYALDKDWIFTLSEGKGLSCIGLEAGLDVGVNAKEKYFAFPDIIALA